MDVVDIWTGRHATALLRAMRQTNDGFADLLGVAVRTVAKWNANPDIEPTPELQQALDTALHKATESERVRFALILGKDQSNGDADSSLAQFAERIAAAASVDSELVQLLEGQTHNYRLLDRRIGASALLAQTQAHVGQITELLRHSLPGAHRGALGAAAAEAAALAGWQALDLGDPKTAWHLHEVAKTAARESENPTFAAHVTAQQGYALLDLQRPADALALIRYARTEGGSKIPQLLESWLWAAEGEALAACGQDNSARAALDEASRRLPATSVSEELPFLALNPIHLGRWRGHCLARLGAVDAVDELSSALSQMDPSFTRATAGLHCDLALAHSVQGDHNAARRHAQLAASLADRTASARQKKRINQLLMSGSSGRPAERKDV